MNLSPELRRELCDLLGRLRDGELDGAQLTKLDSLVGGNGDARRFYLDYVDLCASLHWAQRQNDQRRGMVDSPVMDASVRAAIEPPLQPEPRIPNPESPALPFPSLSTSHYPLPTPFVGGPVFSYMVATLILSVMLLGAWAYQITHFQPQFVESPSKSVSSDVRPDLVFVGRITGMKECRWSDPQTEAYAGASVPLNRKYALASGLMEITYKSGAKVILEGPCIYEVESRAGGYLSLGKLTARIEEGRAKREDRAKPQAISSSLLSPLLSSLFSVRTPTAIVTDLGTEFGVEVDDKGATEVHVLQGEVVSEPRYAGDGSDRSVHVKAGEAARIEPGRSEFTPVALAVNHFVRQLSPPSEPDADAKYIHAILADKPLAYWPLNEPARLRRYADRSGNGFHGWAVGGVRNGQRGPLSPKSRSVAMDGASYIDVGLHERFALTNQFTVEAWISVKPETEMARIISADNAVSDFHSDERIGWSLEYVGTTRFGNTFPCLAFTAYGIKDAAFKTVSVAASKWTHVVVVFDRNNVASLFIDGQLKSTLDLGAVARVGPVWLSLGAMSSKQHLWRGRLAHVAVYPHELSAEQIQNHYQHSLQGPEREDGLRPKAP